MKSANTGRLFPVFFFVSPDSLKLKVIEKWADDEFRSVNSQIAYILDQPLCKSGRWKGKSEGSIEKGGKNY